MTGVCPLRGLPTPAAVLSVASRQDGTGDQRPGSQNLPHLGSGINTSGHWMVAKADVTFFGANTVAWI